MSKVSAVVRLIGERRMARFVSRPPGLWALRAAMRLFAPRHYVGAVGTLFDERGRVLLVEHVFRTDFPWGLPGGWVDGGEDPADAVRREFREELKLEVEVGPLLACSRIAAIASSAAPAHLGFAYYCTLTSGRPAIDPELIAITWADPHTLPHPLAPFQADAARLGRRHFDRVAAGAD